MGRGRRGVSSCAPWSASRRGALIPATPARSPAFMHEQVHRTTSTWSPFSTGWIISIAADAVTIRLIAEGQAACCALRIDLRRHVHRALDDLDRHIAGGQLILSRSRLIFSTSGVLLSIIPSLIRFGVRSIPFHSRSIPFQGSTCRTTLLLACIVGVVLAHRTFDPRIKPLLITALLVFATRAGADARHLPWFACASRGRPGHRRPPIPSPAHRRRDGGLANSPKLCARGARHHRGRRRHLDGDGTRPRRAAEGPSRPSRRRRASADGVILRRQRERDHHPRALPVLQITATGYAYRRFDNKARVSIYLSRVGKHQFDRGLDDGWESMFMTDDPTATTRSTGRAASTTSSGRASIASTRTTTSRACGSTPTASRVRPRSSTSATANR